MLKPLKHVQDLLAHNAELAARLKISDGQLHRLQQENERLKGLKPENERLTERVMLLREEVRWFKEQFFGRSSQKSPAEISSEQKMLFNEAEVLAAIEAADSTRAAQTTTIAEHERRAHSGGREAIPEHLPRKEVLHDLSNAQKHCEHEGVCWAMERIGEEVSERYHYEAPKVWVERQVLRSGPAHGATRESTSPPACRRSCPRAMRAPHYWRTGWPASSWMAYRSIECASSCYARE